MKKNMFFGMYVSSAYSQWKNADLLSSLFAILGLATATIDYEVSYSSKRTHDYCIEEVFEIYRYVNLFFTSLAVIFLCFRYFLKARWYNISKNKSKNSHFISWKSWISTKLIAEVLILCIFPYPTIRGSFFYQQSRITESSEDFDNRISLCYTYSEILYFFMFIRLFFLVRTLFNYTPYQDNHARNHCLLYKTKANLRFSVKSMMQAHPLILIYFSIIPSFFLFGALIRIFERPYSDISGRNFDSLQNAVWNSFITLSTIGYGELFPSTFPGRIIAIVCTMWGAYAFSMIVFTFRKGLELNANQIRALTEIKTTRAAGKTICSLVNFYYAKKMNIDVRESWNDVLRTLERFKYNLRKIKELKKKIGYKEYVSKHHIRELENKIKAINSKVKILLNNE